MMTQPIPVVNKKGEVVYKRDGKLEEYSYADDTYTKSETEIEIPQYSELAITPSDIFIKEASKFYRVENGSYVEVYDINDDSKINGYTKDGEVLFLYHNSSNNFKYVKSPSLGVTFDVGIKEWEMTSWFNIPSAAETDDKNIIIYGQSRGFPDKRSKNVVDIFDLRGWCFIFISVPLN